MARGGGNRDGVSSSTNGKSGRLTVAALTLLRQPASLDLGRHKHFSPRKLSAAPLTDASQYLTRAVFTLQMSLALRTGTSLPEATPGPLLDRLLAHDNTIKKFVNVRRGPDLEASETGATPTGDKNKKQNSASRNDQEAQHISFTWDVVRVSPGN